MSVPWRPDWTCPPGETLQEMLELRGWTQALLAREAGFTQKHVNQVVKGKAGVGIPFALALERLDFGTAEFWVSRDALHRLAVARQVLP